jgi:hypothetical protein
VRIAPLLLWLLGAAACAHRTPPLPALPPLPVTEFAAESLRVDTVAPGLVHTYLWSARGPWAVHVLDADLGACWSLVAVKAGAQAVGRERTSALLGGLARWYSALAATRGIEVGGGVNADFFSFEPPGVPVGPHVGAGRVITGPWVRPAFAVDSAGRPFIGTLATPGILILGVATVPLAGWNQPRQRGVVLYDRGYGPATDTATGAVEIVMRGSPARVVGVDTATAGVAIPPDGVVVVASRTAPPQVRALLATAASGIQARWHVGFTPIRPREAVGGFPVLVADSAVPPDLDSAGGAGFAPVRHPRTAVGIASGGRRLLLVTADGRQLPYSDGMTLRELAELLRSFGAAEALNLDGGGSTTLVVRERGGALAIANRPSDREGERPVANALAVVGRCR